MMNESGDLQVARQTWLLHMIRKCKLWAVIFLTIGSCGRIMMVPGAELLGLYLLYHLFNLLTLYMPRI